MERAILDELNSALEKVRVGIVPQNDEYGSIYIIGDKANLEKAAFIVSSLGYVLSHMDCTNFVTITDFTKYEAVLPKTKLPTSELTSANLEKIMKENYPNLDVAEQNEGVFAVIGDSLHSAEYQLRSMGFIVTTSESMGNFFTVSFLRVKHGAKEDCA